MVALADVAIEAGEGRHGLSGLDAFSDDLHVEAVAEVDPASHDEVVVGVAVHREEIERLSLLGQLRRGIERGELFVHCQPKVSLSTGEVVGVEALVRWQRPERGVVAPDDFIPLAERTGLIGPLTMCVLNTPLAQVGQWADSGRRIPVAVNVSARNLADDFASQVSALLRRHGVAAALLEVEETESAVML